MKRRLILGSLLVALVVSILIPVSPAGARIALRLQANAPLHVGPANDLADLLNYPYDARIQDLEGLEWETVVTTLMDRPEAVQLRMAMARKGFFADLAKAEAMRIVVTVPDGTTRTLEAAAVPMGPGLRVFLPLVLKNYPGSAGPLLPTEPGDEAPMALRPGALSAYLVAMVADDGTSFFQVHHTNLDPELADVPDPPIYYNDIPYFYITTLRIVDGRIVGLSDVPFLCQTAVEWPGEGRPTELPLLDGPCSEAFDSAAGITVGSAGTSDGRSVAVRWTESGPEMIADLGGAYAVARPGLNPAGFNFCESGPILERGR